MKTVTIRMPEDLADSLAKEGESINRTIVDSLTRLQRIRLVSEKELSGVFTKDEWKFFADSLNGTLVDDVFSCNVKAFIAHCEDAERFENTASKWGVDINKVTQKVMSLKGANIEALYDRVKRFWDEEGADIEKWSDF